MRCLFLALGFLLSIGGSANAILCAPSTPPPWPQIGWCQWQPDVNDHNHPDVRDCVGTRPGWGIMWSYPGKTFTGKCSETWVRTPAVNGVYSLDGNFNFMQRNGWIAWNTPTLTLTNVQSIRLGGSDPSWGGVSTSVMFSTGPTAQIPYVYNYYYCSTWNNTAVELPIPDVLAICALPSAFTSFVLSAQ